MTSATETIRSAFSDQEFPQLSYGRPFPETCRKHIDEEFKASRVYILTSRTLANKTDALQRLKDALGEKVAGVRVGMTPHTMISEVLEVVHECQRLDADCIVTLGGGSLSDAAKLAAMALGNDVKTEEDMLKLPYNQPTADPNFAPPKFRFIAIPTSLSGGEYTDYSGATKDSDNMKIQFSPPLLGPKLIILDPELALHSPTRFWLSSGMRAVDHCTETLCSLKSNPGADAAAVQGLQRLIPGLLHTNANDADIGARLDCQLGVVHAMVPLHLKALPGASHGIGHNLGPLGVGHGETSCILLPAVCKYNAAKGANVERQATAKKVLWDIPAARELFEGKGLGEEGADLGDLIDCVVRDLGLPRSLSEVGVGRDRFEMLAVNSLPDVCTMNNPAPLGTMEDVLEILEMVA